MVIAITGSRCVKDYEFFREALDKELKEENLHTVTIISGGAHGADTLAKKYAVENGINFKEFPANWNANGKRAGILRNLEMAEICDRLISFWDTSSRGTYHMIMSVRRLNKPVKIVPYLLPEIIEKSNGKTTG